MLWSETKYINNINNIQHHVELVNNLKKINKDNLQNLFFYGNYGCGKYTIVNLLLKHIFSLKYNILEPVVISNNINFYKNPYYYYIDLHLIGKRKHLIFTEFIKDIINTKNVTTYYQCFVFNNIQLADKNFMKFIKYYLEKKTKTARFIFISNNINKNLIFKVLSSLCLTYRINNLKNKELITVLKSIIDKKNIKLNYPTYNKIINLTNNNLTKSLFLIELKNINLQEFIKYNNRNKKFYNNIYKLLINTDLNNISKLRIIIYNITLKNKDENKFIKKMVLYLINNIFNKNIEENINIIQKILLLGIDTTIKLKRTSKDILIIESFLINLIKILYNTTI